MTDDALRGALAGALGQPIRHVVRRPGAYGSTYPIEDLDVTTRDGGSLRLVFKDLAAPAVQGGKPEALLDPRREIEAYRRVLEPAGLDTPRCYGTGRHWLFLERVDGVPLWQCGDIAVWEAAARWLAGLHARGDARAAHHLVAYDPAWFRGFVDRAAAAVTDGALDRVAAGWDRVVERLSAWPDSFVHGDFYPSNVLVQAARGAAPRVRPIDWELAGVGPGLIDLAALVSGDWTREERVRIALAYRDALPPSDRAGERDLLEALDHARLHVAVQWLGWSSTWAAPAEHAHDWLGDALAIAAELGL